jgi:hypothetical protein
MGVADETSSAGRASDLVAVAPRRNRIRMWLLRDRFSLRIVVLEGSRLLGAGSLVMRQ